MKVIIIENDNDVNNGRAKQSEILYNHLVKLGIDVQVIESNSDFIVKPLSKKQKRKYFAK